MVGLKSGAEGPVDGLVGGDALRGRVWNWKRADGEDDSAASSPRLWRFTLAPLHFWNHYLKDRQENDNKSSGGTLDGADENGAENTLDYGAPSVNRRLPS